MNPMPNEFFKMTAAGNDFIMFDNRAGAPQPEGIDDFVRRLCTRGLCVGADGVILIEMSARADIRARFFNPDGGATFCGNAARCVARLAYLNGWAPARMVVETDLGLHRAEISGSEVSFEMRDPSGFEEMTVDALARSWRGALVGTGVPHFVVIGELPAEGAPTGRPQSGRYLRLALGWVLTVAGAILGPVPVLPGAVLLIPGLAILCAESRWVRSVLRRYRQQHLMRKALKEAERLGIK